MNRLRKRLFLPICCIFLLMAVFAIGGIWRCSSEAVTTIAKIENDDQNYSVVFQEIGTAFTFGPSHVRVILEDGSGNEVSSLEDDICNDGCRLNKENIQVDWQSDYVEITLFGKEQKSRSHQLHFA